MTGVSTTESGPRRLPRTRSHVERAATEVALEPVKDALIAGARARAQAARAEAEADARAELARARAEANHLLAEARADGDQAGRRAAAALVAAARREAHETVLAARRTAYEAFRHGALEALLHQRATPEGHRLSELLVALVTNRVGGSASVRLVGPGNLAAVAEAGNRRATLGPAELVDQALESLAAEMEGLWA